MSLLTYNHFGNIATFDEEQAVVVRAVAEDFVKTFGENVLLQVANEELEEKLKTKELELRELQEFIDLSISSLDPDRE